MPVYRLLWSTFYTNPYVSDQELTQIANISQKDVVIDLGSGDGRMLIHAARQGATAKGWEINPFLVLWTRLAIHHYKVGKRATVHLKNYHKANLSEATVVFIYNFPPHMPKLEEKLKKDLQKGTTIISYKFIFPTLELIENPKPDIFIYTI